jgi:predicted phosphohydrolase
MALFAIGDLHLSLSADKPMDIFGKKWEKHAGKIKDNWLQNIGDEDTVLIPGDISWAMKLEDALCDLEWISCLPGKKILLRGNHDYWWSSLSKMNNLFDNMYFLQNNYYRYKDYAICGTRGWTCPNEVKFNEHDRKIYEREIHRLRLSIEAASKNGLEKYIVMIHYPPTNEKHEKSGFIEIFEEYKVEKVIYGHLHGTDSFKVGIEGIHNGIEYILASSDYIDFNPIKVLL